MPRAPASPAVWLSFAACATGVSWHAPRPLSKFAKIVGKSWAFRVAYRVQQGRYPMSLAQLFRSPFVRIPFLGFAIFSSVATSQPAWSVDDQTPEEHIAIAAGQSVAIAAGQSVDRRFAYDASDTNLKVKLHLDDFSSPSSASRSLKIVGEECGFKGVYEKRSGEDWKNVDPPQAYVQSGADLTLENTCLAKSGTLALRIENVGAGDIAFDLHAEASLSGNGDEPPGAFAHIEVLP
jgi:hypothetical protein